MLRRVHNIFFHIHKYSLYGEERRIYLCMKMPACQTSRESPAPDSNRTHGVTEIVGSPRNVSDSQCACQLAGP